jgi:hypothetical protein
MRLKRQRRAAARARWTLPRPGYRPRQEPAMIVRALVACCIAGAATLSLLLAGCGQTRQIVKTYIKKDMSESKMLQDETELKRTGGVKQVIAHIDSGNTVTLDLYLDEDDDAKGRQKAIDLGYIQVRN